MRRIVMMLALLTLGGSPALGKRDEPATEEEQGAVMRSYIGCLVEKATALDDGISDAATVALPVASACGDHEEELIAVWVKRKKRPQSVAAYFRRDWDSFAIRSATEVVINVRMKRREQ